MSMKTITHGDYLDAKRDMKEAPTIEAILRYVEIVTALKGCLPVFYYDLANIYLKKCK
jgi:hypothetical protein